MAGQNVDFRSNGGTTPGYLARPSSGRGPGVIVIQEWWGLNDQIKGMADRFAQEGFTALAPDFYHGKGVQIGEPDEAGKLMMALNIDQTAKGCQGRRGVPQAGDRRQGGGDRLLHGWPARPAGRHRRALAFFRQNLG